MQLEDNSVALIEIGLYNSIVEQSKKRGQSSKDNVKSFQCPNDGCNKSYSTMHHLRVRFIVSIMLYEFEILFSNILGTYEKSYWYTSV